jgi:hypothetical protein
MPWKKIKTDGTEHHGMVVTLIASNSDITDANLLRATGYPD